MKTIIAIICLLASMLSTPRKSATISDVCKAQLYAMGTRCVSVDVVDDQTDVVTVENCNGQQFTFEAPRYDYFPGDDISCIICDMGTPSILDDVIVSACYDRYDLLKLVD